MEPLLRFVEVADAQQLQGPFIDRIQAAGILGLGITAKQQGRDGFHANPLAAETVGGQLVAGLQEGHGHAFGFFAGAVDPSDALDHLNAAGFGAQGRINQHRLPHGHADGPLGAIGEMAELHRGLAVLLRAARNIAGPRGLLRVILNCNKLRALPRPLRAMTGLVRWIS